MEFSPSNPIVKLCLQALAQAEQGKAEDATRLFQKAWDSASDDFERFLAAHFLASRQMQARARLSWLEKALQHAQRSDPAAVQSALPPLYGSLAQCHEDLHEPAQAQGYRALAAALDDAPIDPGPYYHGTKADLKPGDLLTAGATSNYKPDLKMNHIYFTALAHGAGLAAAMAKGDQKERVYIVEPTGRFENDPNVTNKKFPGNPTRSYRSEAPLKVVGEAGDWAKPAPEELEKWRQRVVLSEGKIIN